MKRILAIVASRLACELARQKVQGKKTEAGKRAKPAPLAVILEREGGGAPVLETATIDVIDDEARRLGVRAGQTVTSATALASHLEVHRITYGEIDAALGRIAEVAMAFGPTAALRLRESPEDAHRTPWGDAPFDTVWLDITGAAHLAGGEEELLDELAERASVLGHSVRLAIAGGPRLAQSLARHSPGLAGAPGSRASRHPIAAPNGGKQAMAPLPVQALPIDPDTASWLMRLGVITVGDLARLPRPAALARLGARGVEALDLAAGRDDIPLLPYAAPRIIEESIAFRNRRGDRGRAALRAPRHDVARRRAPRRPRRGRRAHRGDAAPRPIDRRPPPRRSRGRREPRRRRDRPGFPRGSTRPARRGGRLAPRSPRQAGAHRALRARDRHPHGRPQIVSARRVQLDLGRGKALDPDKLPALLAELSADIGADRIGVLSIQDAHRPEGRSKLRPANVTSRTLRRDAQMAFLGRGARLLRSTRRSSRRACSPPRSRSGESGRAASSPSISSSSPSTSWSS